MTYILIAFTALISSRHSAATTGSLSCGSVPEFITGGVLQVADARFLHANWTHLIVLVLFSLVPMSKAS
jgi:hypothetical protein